MEKSEKMLEMVKSSYDGVNKIWKGFESHYPYQKEVYLGEKVIECLKNDPKRL